jgi:hypothetical protein
MRHMAWGLQLKTWLCRIIVMPDQATINHKKYGPPIH